eukprot:m.131600 g.131600  ORF g.131600 m.131600 type:complete len:362 (+) comp16824_c1_seq2:247-1332(+)
MATCLTVSSRTVRRSSASTKRGFGCSSWRVRLMHYTATTLYTSMSSPKTCSYTQATCACATLGWRAGGALTLCYEALARTWPQSWSEQMQRRRQQQLPKGCAATEAALGMEATGCPNLWRLLWPRQPAQPRRLLRQQRLPWLLRQPPGAVAVDVAGGTSAKHTLARVTCLRTNTAKGRQGRQGILQGLPVWVQLGALVLVAAQQPMTRAATTATAPTPRATWLLYLLLMRGRLALSCMLCCLATCPGKRPTRNATQTFGGFASRAGCGMMCGRFRRCLQSCAGCWVGCCNPSPSFAGRWHRLPACLLSTARGLRLPTAEVPGAALAAAWRSAPPVMTSLAAKVTPTAKSPRPVPAPSLVVV